MEFSLSQAFMVPLMITPIDPLYVSYPIYRLCSWSLGTWSDFLTPQKQQLFRMPDLHRDLFTWESIVPDWHSYYSVLYFRTCQVLCVSILLIIYCVGYWENYKCIENMIFVLNGERGGRKENSHFLSKHCIGISCMLFHLVLPTSLGIK